MIKNFLFILTFLFLIITVTPSALSQVGGDCLVTPDVACNGWDVKFTNPNPGTRWELRWRHEWRATGEPFLQHTTTKSNMISSGQTFSAPGYDTDRARTSDYAIHWATTCADPYAYPHTTRNDVDNVYTYYWDINIDPVLVPNDGTQFHVGNGDNLGTVPWTGSTAEGNFTSGSKARCYPRYSCATNGSGNCVLTNCDPGDNNCYDGQNARQCNPNNCRGPISGQVFLPNGDPYNGKPVRRNNNAGNTDTTSGNGDFRFGNLAYYSQHDIRLLRQSEHPNGVDTCAYTLNDWQRDNVQVINNNVNFNLNNVLYNITARAFWDPEADGVNNSAYTRDSVTFTTNPGGRSCSTSDGSCVIDGNPTDPGGRDYDITLSGVPAEDMIYSNNPLTRRIVCGNVGVNFAITREFRISGNIFKDLNFNTRRNPGEALYTNANSNVTNTIRIQGQGSRSNVDRTQTVTDGTFEFVNLFRGTYVITINSSASNNPEGYRFSTPTSYTVTVAPGGSCNDGNAPQSFCVTAAPWVGNVEDLNFGITPIYSVSGGVFEDEPNASGNYNNRKDANEDYMPGQQIILRQNGAVFPNDPDIFRSANPQTTTNSGYTFSYLLQEAYRVVYNWTYQIYMSFDSFAPSAAPTTLPFFQLNLTRNPVDSDCVLPDVGNHGCYAFGVPNLNFALRRIIQQAYMQTFGGDVRVDKAITNRLPDNRNFSGNIDSNSLTNGIIFGNPVIDPGDYGPRDWHVDDAGMGAGSIKTSYAMLEDSIIKSGNNEAIKTNVPCPNCNIQSFNFNQSGNTLVFKLGGNSVINTSTPTENYQVPNNKNVIILVPGNLTINTNIEVPPGSTITFAAGGNITIGGSVRTLQGIYSAGGDFIFATLDPLKVGVTPDTPIRVEGSIIVAGNLDRRRALTPRESRDGWNGQPGPTATIAIYFRPDFVLNLPPLIRTALSKRIEVAPGGE